LVACLQTKDGKGWSWGETAKEFEDTLALVLKDVQALQQQHPQWRHAGATYTWDSASFHTRAHLPFSSG
jgi:hypothetical protein